MKKIVIASLLTACVAFAGSYDKCVVCHGANGEKAALGKSKVIKDMSKADFVAALKGYQNGTYGGAQKGLMVGQVKDMNEATMNEIADLIIK
ncbi:cytochrome C [Arcobacter suis]|mgnify:CR=1 FL=1|uniref:Periplasmic monoheme cytochrome c553 n=1 Tax=Arcobacter suis CECT 7833 TaxID=663365 RepID=A0AAD0WQE8_9BACT|nr:c-type cytochrome [Arcobacter suis]AXX89715.1 periplasmic monoheme cytochrome c553 [Arcobacter suis CECT 7833]RWS46035.1 cytochrome C [Arcobacter suis]